MGYLQVIANGYQGVGSPGIYGRNFAAANNTGSVRTATLTLSIAGSNTITVPVQQAAQ